MDSSWTSHVYQSVEFQLVSGSLLLITSSSLYYSIVTLDFSMSIFFVSTYVNQRSCILLPERGHPQQDSGKSRAFVIFADTKFTVFKLHHEVRQPLQPARP